MANEYVTVEWMKERLAVRPDSQTITERMERVITRASRMVDKVCHRRFYADTAATARRFAPASGCVVRVDDFHTTDGLIVAVDYGDDGTFEQVLSATDYELEPVNGVVDGEAGWPYMAIRLVSGLTFPAYSRRKSVQVTAKWGWTAVPDPVVEATEVIAAELFKMGDAPLGVAGFGEFGVVRVRSNPKAAEMLAPYVRDPVLVA